MLDSADDLEVVNTELPVDISSAITDGQDKQQDHPLAETQIVRVTEKLTKTAESRHLGDKNDWGNGTPILNSEDKHYWAKEKKTKPNINNVNHRMKDFSSNFFYPTVKHDFLSTEEDDETVQKSSSENKASANGVTNNKNSTQSKDLSDIRRLDNNATDLSLIHI